MKKLFIITLLLFPLVAGAQVKFPYWGPLVSCSGDLQSAQPCTSLCDLFKTGQNIIYFMMTLAVLIVGPVMIVVGGLFLLVSAGSQTMTSRGRKMITGAVIGIAIALGAFIIVNTFFYALAIATSGEPRSWFDIQCSAPASLNPPT